MEGFGERLKSLRTEQGLGQIALTKSETVAKRFIELVRARHPNFAGHVLHAAADGVRVETK